MTKFKFKFKNKIKEINKKKPPNKGIVFKLLEKVLCLEKLVLSKINFFLTEIK